MFLSVLASVGAHRAGEVYKREQRERVKVWL